MNKLYIFAVALFCFSTTSFAQLPDGSIAPDFTIEDIDGNTHNLYDLLNDGKIVIIDLFATWCGPCWSYHQEHILADLYEARGPNGTDDLRIFAIESDSRTNLDCLYGQTDCNYNSIGDWVDGVPYPIADNRSVFADYQANYYPTIFTIFPNRKVYESGQLTYSAYENFIEELGPELSPGIAPSILEMDVLSGTICRMTETRPQYLINNQGEETIESADISVTVNGESRYEDAWTGSIKPWGIITSIALPTLTIEENSIIEFRMDNINGDSNSSFSHVSEILADVSNTITVSVSTDAKARVDNNRFTIINLFGKTIATEQIDKPNTDYTFELELEDLSCHIFTVFDDGGDGIDGSFEVKDDLGNVIYNKSDFGSAAEFAFNASVNTNVDDVLTDVEVSLRPNPVYNDLIVELASEDAKLLNVSITSIQGEQIYNASIEHSGLSTQRIDVHSIPSGLYFLNINDGVGNLTKKFVKN